MDFNTLTHNQNQTAFSFIYFLLPCHLCDRRKDVPVSIKKQDACISRQQKSSWEHQGRLVFVFFNKLYKTCRQIVSALSTCTATWAYIQTYKQVSPLQRTNNFLFLIGFKRQFITWSYFHPNLLPIKLEAIKILNQGPKYEKCLHIEIFYRGWQVPGGHASLGQAVDIFILPLRELSALDFFAQKGHSEKLQQQHTLSHCEILCTEMHHPD